VSPDSLRVLQDRLAQLRDGGPSASSGDSNAAAPGVGSSIRGSVRGSGGGSGGGGGSADDYASEAAGAAARSFSEAGDDELKSALSRRISEIATATGEWGSTVDEEDMRKPLTGEVSGHWVGLGADVCGVGWGQG